MPCEIVESSLLIVEYILKNEKFNLQSPHETFDATDREFFVEDGTGSVEYRKYSDVGQYSKQIRSSTVERRARNFA